MADIVMSLDNVLAVAAAADGNMSLLVIGLALSIPLIVFGSTLLVKTIARFPIIITLGAALLGFSAGQMLVTDPAVTARFGSAEHGLVNGIGAIGAGIVVGVDLWLQRRARARSRG